MKKVFVILSVALLSFLFIGQTTFKICTLPTVLIAEYVVDASIHVTDHSEEDFTAIDHQTPIERIIDETFVDGSVSLKEKITPFIWQPPKSLIFKGL